MSQALVSQLQLEQYALGELSSRDHKRIAALIESSRELQERLQGLERSNSEILQAYPALEVAREVQRRRGLLEHPSIMGRADTGWAKAPMGWLLASACLIAAMSFMGPFFQEEQGLRIKGMTPYLVAHQVVDGKTQLLEQGSALGQGDRLQLSIVGGLHLHAVVFSIDGASTITLHYPLEEADAQPLVEATVSLPNSYELDDAPRFERFFLVTQDAPLSRDDILESGRKLTLEKERGGDGMLEGLPQSARQSSFFIRKIP